MRIFGFKPVRFHEWLDVVREEGRQLSRWDFAAMLLKMIRMGLIGTFKERGSWRKKMRRCYKCPIFDRKLKRCRPFTGSPLGCGCYTPFLALVAKQCWADENELKEIGWKSR